MNVTIFYDNMEQLSSFFGKKISKEQREFYFNEMSYITDNAFESAIRSIIRSRKPNPSQFPNIDEIKGMCEHQKARYKRNETENEYYGRVQIADMWEAFNVLKTKGNDAFLAHCQERNINEQDIERIQTKYRLGLTPAKIKENLKRLHI